MPQRTALYIAHRAGKALDKSGLTLLLQAEEEEKLRKEFEKQGIKIPKKDRSQVFDSNTITPGTPFMHRLSIALQYYIHLRLNSDPGWRGITVSHPSACCSNEMHSFQLEFL